MSQVILPNVYSAQWFDAFLAPIPPEQTAREIDFLARCLLQPYYMTVLDVCCGTGRHARGLARRGYRVTGLDASAYALEQARRADPTSRYVQGDIRALDTFETRFDSVLLLWQSFGNFDEASNLAILQQIRDVLNPRGRFVLDIYNRAFFEAHLGERRIETASRIIQENKTMRRERLRVELDYGDAQDIFEWQLFYPDEISALAFECGMREILRCADFDELRAPSPEIARMQFVFEQVS